MSTSSAAGPSIQPSLPPTEDLLKFKVADDLQMECVLHEPDIAQPIFVSFDARGRLWVVEYRQYPDPVGLKEISRDSAWRTVYDKVPPPPPKHFVGADRISIHDDTDGDGVYDQHKTFLDGLNLVTAVAHGRGGVWVLNPPYLLFYADKNHDDVPDTDPEVHLAGFGLEDTHAVVNSLRFGPDGWLYACQGSTVTGNVTRPGLDDKPVHSQGQAIWRYHPQTRRYEIFAEGGGNAFGLEFDSQGRIFSGHNGGDTRGFHYVQGGYYQKGFGKHGPLSNPFTFGYFPAMKHHAAQRFTHNFVIYEGAALPESYRGKLLGVSPLLNEVVISEVQRDGSSFRTKDVGHLLRTSNKRFLPVDIKVGPDGAVYIVDMEEPYPSHRDHHIGRIDRSTGRVYRVRAKGPKPTEPIGDLAKKSTAELVALLRHKNKWQRQTALQLLGDRQDKATLPQLLSMLQEGDDQAALEALWAIYQCGGLDEHRALEALAHKNSQVRLWTVRLLCDDRQVSVPIARRLVELAAHENDIEVRSQLACSARRLPADQALPIVRQMLTRDEDAADLHVPLLAWWALEAKITEDAPAVLRLFEPPEIWKLPLVQQFVTERLMRRFAATGKRDDLLVCAKLLKLAPDRDEIKRLLAGFETATAGRALAAMPEELASALAQFGGQSVVLGLRQGRTESVAEALRTLTDTRADKSKQLLYMQILGEVNQPRCVPVLLELFEHTNDGALQVAALAALSRYPDPKIATLTLLAYSNLPDEVRSAAQLLLASRKEWSLRLLEAIDAGAISAGTVPIDVVQHLQQHRDTRIAALVRKHWGELKPLTTAEAEAEIARVTQAIHSGRGVPKAGKKLFAETCAKCHALLGEGGRVGPDLTSFQRDNLRPMLVAIVHPNAEIREGYTNYLATTDDGRVVTGLLVDQDPTTVVLRTNDGRDVPLSRRSIDELRAQSVSLMPEDLLKNYSDQQLRDLFAYLRSSQPLVD
ncbi:MAG: c-type cytochrome [Pirellulales bacterium]|nr:c-type cytochrome [Pirellulales bacterium]